LEDADLVRRLRKRAALRRIPEPIVTSPRRYLEEGRWTGWLRNTAIICLYLAGASPGRLARFHRPRRPNPRRILLVFGKAPIPGKVKTRLAAEVGADYAAEVYRALGRKVVDQLRGGAFRMVICFDPPEARQAMEEWLGRNGVEYRAQAQGDLGARLKKAIRDAFLEADRVVVVGTDAPGVDRELVEEAFRRLQGKDVVLGPSKDGGYYLLGLSEPAPELFEGIPWSTEGVLQATRERATLLGLREHTLATLADVDTLDDLRALRLELAPSPLPSSLLK
ncbi:TIGR04282 family arsenosugar biosynthesis glycosyltransferase, partial [Gemmatimonadota bacterium]